jgi:hypothetical protein
MALADDAPAAAPAGPTLSQILVNSGITVAGYVDASYEASFNSTSGLTSGEIKLHEFDTNSNTFEVNQAALTVSYLPTSGFGALVNVIAGEDAKVINATMSPGSSSDIALTQAYAQYAVGNLTVIGGRFVTLAGEEVINDTANANISRSLLFTNLEPLVHTGVRATYKVIDPLSVTLGVNNSADGVSADTDKHKTLEANVAYTPTTAITVALTDYYGIDGASAESKVNYSDFVASWQATTALLVAANLDYVHTASNIAGTPTTNAEGGALYASYQLTDSWKASLRGEYLRTNPGGPVGFVLVGGTPTPVSATSSDVAELTATVDYSASKSFDVLGEVRDDYGTALYFPSAYNSTSGAQKSQAEVLVKAIYKFGTPTGS